MTRRLYAHQEALLAALFSPPAARRDPFDLVFADYAATEMRALAHMLADARPPSPPPYVADPMTRGEEDRLRAAAKRARRAAKMLTIVERYK